MFKKSYYWKVKCFKREIFQSDIGNLTFFPSSVSQSSVCQLHLFFHGPIPKGHLSCVKPKMRLPSVKLSAYILRQMILLAAENASILRAAGIPMLHAFSHRTPYKAMMMTTATKLALFKVSWPS